MRRAAVVLVLALAAAAAAAGCAAPVPAPVVAPAPPAPAPSRPGVPGGTGAAERDSSPTPEALAVLATIPEPLGAVPAPVGQAAPPETYDTLRAEVPARDMPVPAPTQPLGSSATLPATPPPAAAIPAAAIPVAAATAGPDTCWRVQVAAPSDREKGKSMRDASESLLMVPMLVDREGGRFKVRSRDCLSRAAAEALKVRAIDSGFKGAFLVRLPGTR